MNMVDSSSYFISFLLIFLCMYSSDSMEQHFNMAAHAWHHLLRKHILDQVSSSLVPMLHQMEILRLLEGISL